MKTPELLHVWPIKGYRLLLEYKGGERRVYDALHLIDGYWHNHDKEVEYAQTVHVSGGGIAWADGQNVDPWELWNHSVPV